MRGAINKLLILAAVGLGLYYLAYRVLYTLNPNAFTLSILCYAAEVHGFVAACLLFFGLWPTPRPSRAPEPQAGLSVDVLIPADGEDVEVLRRMVQGACAMTYPHQTYVLDDGSRPAVARLADDLRVRRLTRESYAHGRAGMINYALAKTEGDLLVVFDADQVPRPDFLERTLGFFRDPKVAFVQAPQFFYRPDVIDEGSPDEPAGRHDGEALFYDVIQPAKQRRNAALFCGTCAVLRRTALQGIGGLPIDTPSADYHASMLMHAKGWKSVYICERLATGLTPEDSTSYSEGRVRRQLGDLKLFYRCNPILKWGLSLGQRLSYLSTLHPATSGPQRLVFYLVPPLMLLTGVSPVRSFTQPLLVLFAGALLMRLIALKAASYGKARILGDECHNLAYLWPMLVGTFTSPFAGAERSATPSPAHGDAVPKRLSVPQVALFLVSYTAILWVALQLLFAVKVEPLATGFAVFWSLFYAGVAATVLGGSLLGDERRRDHRHQGVAPVVYRLASDPPNTERLGMAHDCSSSGMAMLSYQPLPIGEDFEADLVLSTSRVSVRARALYFNRGFSHGGAVFGYGVRFVDIEPKSRHLLDLETRRQALPVEVAAADAGTEEGLLSRIGQCLGGSRRRTQLWAGLPVNLNPTPGNWRLARLVGLKGLTARLAVTSEPDMQSETDFVLLSPLGLVTGRLRVNHATEARFGDTRYWDWTVYLEDLDAESTDRMSRLAEG